MDDTPITAAASLGNLLVFATNKHLYKLQISKFMGPEDKQIIV